MIEEKLLLSSNKEKQLSYQSRYDSIELKKLSRTVLMQYYVCCSMPCVRALGYIQQGSVARASGGQELEENNLVSRRLLPSLKEAPPIIYS